MGENVRENRAGRAAESGSYVPLKELNLTNHFLFGEVMNDPETCRTALEIILGRKISKVIHHNREQDLEIHPLYKGIRLDVCFEDEEDTVYSVEIQNVNRYHLPRRSRHYQSMVDVKMMKKGEVDYRKLPDGIVIFICTFDLFGYGRYCYTFENRCLEEPELALGDGTKKIFLNTRGCNDDETNQELIEFLRCIEHTNEMRTVNEKIGKILERVRKVKQDAQAEGRYMTTREWMNELRADAIEEGLELGRQEGKVLAYAEMGLSAVQIADKVGISEIDVRGILENN